MDGLLVRMVEGKNSEILLMKSGSGWVLMLLLQVEAQHLERRSAQQGYRQSQRYGHCPGALSQGYGSQF